MQKIFHQILSSPFQNFLFVSNKKNLAFSTHLDAENKGFELYENLNAVHTKLYLVAKISWKYCGEFSQCPL